MKRGFPELTRQNLFIKESKRAVELTKADFPGLGV